MSKKKVVSIRLDEKTIRYLEDKYNNVSEGIRQCILNDSADFYMLQKLNEKLSIALDSLNYISLVQEGKINNNEFPLLEENESTILKNSIANQIKKREF